MHKCNCTLNTLSLIANHTGGLPLAMQFYRKIHYLTSELHVKFHAKNRYCMNRKVMSAISVFQVKFNVEFTCQAVNLSARAETKETLSKSMRFLILLSVNGFLKFSKILNFNSRFGKHSFSVNLFISKEFFSQHELHFCFHDSYDFCLRLTSAMSLHAQVQFHTKYPLFNSQSECGFTFSYAILRNIYRLWVNRFNIHA